MTGSAGRGGPRAHSACAWWHVGMLGPCTVHAHAHARMYRRPDVQMCRGAGGTANERLSGCNQMVAVEGPERVEVEQSTLSGRELSADWRSGPAGEHLVCREVGTRCQSPCKAAFLITSTGVLQRLHTQGCPGLPHPPPCPPRRAFHRPWPAALPYQSTRPFFPSLIDPFTCSLARAVGRAFNQSIHQSPIVCPALPMPRLDHPLLRVLLPGRPRSFPALVCSPHPTSVPCRTSELTD